MRRFDRIDGALIESRRRDDGSWWLSGRAAKAGVLRYVLEDGSPFVEYFPPEELARADSVGLNVIIATE